MIKGIYQNARKLNIQERNFESVANNLANINTSGYKKQLPFSEVLSQAGDVKIKQYSDFTQGELVATNNTYDMAISGEGYFVVNTDQGYEYTRNGRFSVTQEGFLVDNKGNKVMGEQGEINVFNIAANGAKDVQINKNGDIKVGDEVVDTLKIVKFEDEQDAVRVSGSNFVTGDTNVVQVESDKYQINQGYLESSNVNPVMEMESMIQMNNDYESAQKMMKYLDQSLGHATEVGKV
jgi:flagellar basal-body rod protein FlgG